MTDKLVIVHKSVIEAWANQPPEDVDPEVAAQVLQYIQSAIDQTPPDQQVTFEGYDFNSLPDQVGIGNNATLVGARVGWCLKEARAVLEEAGIPVTLNTKGSMT